MGFGKQRTHKKIFKPKNHEKVLLSIHKITIEKKEKVLPWKQLLRKTSYLHEVGTFGRF